MQTLVEWSAKRSGGRITITGRDGQGAPIKVPNVDTIEARPSATSTPSVRVIATDKDKREYLLATPH